MTNIYHLFCQILKITSFIFFSKNKLNSIFFFIKERNETFQPKKINMKVVVREGEEGVGSL
jgi:hypothetical protein